MKLDVLAWCQERASDGMIGISFPALRLSADRPMPPHLLMDDQATPGKPKKKAMPEGIAKFREETSCKHGASRHAALHKLATAASFCKSKAG